MSDENIFYSSTEAPKSSTSTSSNKVLGGLCSLPMMRSAKYQFSHIGHNNELIYTFTCNIGYAREGGARQGEVSCLKQEGSSVIWSESGQQLDSLPECIFEKNLLIGLSVGLPLLLLIVILSVLYAKEKRLNRHQKSRHSATQLTPAPLPDQRVSMRVNGISTLPRNFSRKEDRTLMRNAKGRQSADGVTLQLSTQPESYRRPSLYPRLSANKPLPNIPRNDTYLHPLENMTSERNIFRGKANELTSHRIANSVNHVVDQRIQQDTDYGVHRLTNASHINPVFVEEQEFDQDEQAKHISNYDNNVVNWTLGRSSKDSKGHSDSTSIESPGGYRQRKESRSKILKERIPLVSSSYEKDGNWSLGRKSKTLRGNSSGTASKYISGSEADLRQVKYEDNLIATFV